MRRTALLVAALLVAAVSPVTGSPAAASCAAPTLRVDGPRATPPVIGPGHDVTVEGRFFVDGCDDTGGGQTGPFGCDDEPVRSEERPMRDVELVLRQRGREWSLGAADARADGRVTWTVRLPVGVRPGPARLRTAESEVLPVVVPGR